ncbi:hypothetical protein BROUX41_005579 [Berkeleyomyces rouxiae]|uniref:uncharacterized protein n=1 Tax=Berkeleyomyces rouxiae TaxID=2035830 RepID=UPI003B76845E
MATIMDSINGFLATNPLAKSVADVLESYSERRQKLGLPNPGTSELLTKEVQREVLPSGYMFSGIKADITKIVGTSPFFQVSHQFAMGERQSPYAFATLYGTDDVFMQSQLDNEGTCSARMNYRWTPALMTKAQVQMSPNGNMAQFDHDYSGSDFTASLKMINPSALSGGLTGIFLGSYLQSITPKLALGFESVYQRPAMTQGPETAVSLMGRYKAEDWAATAQLQAQGAFIATYWKRLSDKVQAGVDMQLSLAPSPAMMGGGISKEGLTTVGLKYDFRMATFRAQIDSSGKIGCLIEKRTQAPVSLTFAAEFDHWTQTPKIGFGLSVESQSEELQAAAELGSPPPMPNVPF